MTSIPTHIHISEREADGTWEDCTWDSGLEFYRDAFDARKPATHAEAQALRRASGEPDTGGSNLGDFARGVKARYGVTLPAPVAARTILSVLTPGKCATVQGSMAAFGSTNPLSKWDRNFDGGHAVYLANVGGVLLWCDPEAPTTADVPVIISRSDVQKFVDAFPGGQALVAPIKVLAAPAQENPNMLPVKTLALNATAVIKAQSNIRVEPVIASTKVRTTTADTTVTSVVGWFTGDKDPANGLTDWLGWLEGGAWRFTAKDNVLSVKQPVVTADDGFTKATQDAAVAAAVAPLNARIAILQPLADRLAAIKAALGL